MNDGQEDSISGIIFDEKPRIQVQLKGFNQESKLFSVNQITTVGFFLNGLICYHMPFTFILMIEFLHTYTMRFFVTTLFRITKQRDNVTTRIHS